MNFNPLTNELFSKHGALIKKLSCPLSKQWDQFSPQDQSGFRNCDHCEKPVFDTSVLEEKALIRLMENDPEACLKVAFDQHNIMITHERPC